MNSLFVNLSIFAGSSSSITLASRASHYILPIISNPLISHVNIVGCFFLFFVSSPGKICGSSNSSDAYLGNCTLTMLFAGRSISDVKSMVKVALRAPTTAGFAVIYTE